MAYDETMGRISLPTQVRADGPTRAKDRGPSVPEWAAALAAFLDRGLGPQDRPVCDRQQRLLSDIHNWNLTIS